MPALPIDLAQIFLLCTSQIHARRHLLPLAAAPSAAGGVRACSTERLHGLGSSSSFGGGCARPAASSNDLIAQAQIVPSSRLEFDPKLFPPSQPQTPNRSPSWTAFFKKKIIFTTFAYYLFKLMQKLPAKPSRATVYGSIVDWTTFRRIWL